MNNKTGYRTFLDPVGPLKIGFIGKIHNSAFFTIFSSLEKEGIPVEALPYDSSTEMDSTFNNRVTMATNISGRVSAASIALISVSLGLTVANEKRSTLKYIALNGPTPLCKAMGLRHPLFGKKQLAKKSFQVQAFYAVELRE
jgi:acetylglutamate kinase